MRWKWLGDTNPEHGGTWVRPVPEHGYADAVRITPCSDGDGPNNWFWVEVLTIAGLDDEVMVRQAVAAVGWEIENNYQKAEALMLYGAYDTAWTDTAPSAELVQVGKKRDQYCRNEMPDTKPTVTLRGNACIRRYARHLADRIC